MATSTSGVKKKKKEKKIKRERKRQKDREKDVRASWCAGYHLSWL